MTEKNTAAAVSLYFFDLLVLDLNCLIQLPGDPEVVIEHCDVKVMYLTEQKPGAADALSVCADD